MKTIIVINIITWYQDEDTQKRLSTLPLKTQWTIRKNIKILEPVFNNFSEFRDHLTKQRNADWFVEGNGKCDKIEQDGKEVLQIRDEFIKDFTAYDENLNTQLNEILEEENDIEDSLQSINIDDLLEIDCDLNINDLEIISVLGVQ